MGSAGTVRRPSRESSPSKDSTEDGDTALRWLAVEPQKKKGTKAEKKTKGSSLGRNTFTVTFFATAEGGFHRDSKARLV